MYLIKKSKNLEVVYLIRIFTYPYELKATHYVGNEN